MVGKAASTWQRNGKNTHAKSFPALPKPSYPQTTNIISITPKPLTAVNEPEYVYGREETVCIIDNRGIERFKVIQADDK